MKIQSKCESCESETLCEIHYGNMQLCDDCWHKELEAEKELKATESARLKEYDERTQKIIEQNRILRESQAIDSSIRIRSDIFNAKTVSILELRDAINSNPEIENKPYELAKVLLERFNHFKTVVFELNQQLIDAGHEQKAIQVHLNTLATQLRTEEREKLKIADINYKPAAAPIKRVKEIKIRQTSPKTKIDKKELREAASKIGVNEFTLQMICVQKNMTVKDGMEFLMKMKESK